MEIERESKNMRDKDKERGRKRDKLRQIGRQTD